MTRSETVRIRARDGGEFDAYLSIPAGAPAPGIVLVQEIFGVNAYMRSVADWFAERGYTVACPDLFWRQRPGIQLTDRTEGEWQQAFALMKGMDQDKAIEDTASTLALLRVHPACDGRVGCLGYCLGGRLAYLTACRDRPDCCVGYYGVGIESLLGEAKGIRTPLMLHIAGKDSYCSAEARSAIHRALDSHPMVTLHDYPDQGHAFARDGGEHYDARAAELANLRTLEFFARNLTGAKRST